MGVVISKLIKKIRKPRTRVFSGMTNHAVLPYEPPHFDRLLQLDGYLGSYKQEFFRRFKEFRISLDLIENNEGLDNFTKSYESYGINVNRSDNSVYCFEWAPGADALSLVGDFNNWDVNAHTYEKLEFGKWRLVIPAKADGSCAIPHNSIIKVVVRKDGESQYKLSPWVQYVTCAKNETIFHQQFYNPPEQDRYKLKASRPQPPKSLRIYEAHVGISSQHGCVNTYRNFADEVIPRIQRQGYNTIQLMAVMEHAYYASFGYQVTSFFAASSRCGTPDDLKYLVDKAHEAGITMLLDIVHSHASKNVDDGLNKWDGTNGCYFHDNARGFHTLWDSRLFNYNQIETQRFLLSNLRWWIEEYGFDGFRFDGVTSMIYHSHGMNDSFGHYDDYFGLNGDTDSIVYLMLANYMLHKFYPFVTTIAEEVSGMPGLCRSIEEGGQGFDYRLAMAIPDLWIKLLKHTRDEDWKINEIVHQLENRRYGEKHVAYAESHDQALVGDKTIAFWLMDKEMYDNMSVSSPMTPVIDRGLAFHKMIRMLTYGLGGEAWLNFMGNEFGHPEWLDFPRIGNNESYHYCRRQWNLVDDNSLRYKFLNNFDKAMNTLEDKHHFLARGHAYVSWKHEGDKVIAFERGGLVFIFNFNNTQSFPGYKVGVHNHGYYRIALDSDSEQFGGHSRLDHGQTYQTYPEGYAGRPNHIPVYIPTRTVIVLEHVN